MQDHWGKLLLEYAELDNNSDVLNRFELQKDILDLQNAYTVIKAMLKRLMIIPPDHKTHGQTSSHYINDLMKLGYRIDTDNRQAYQESILRADKKSNSIITQIQMKKNLLKGDVEEKHVSFDSISAVISAELKFMIPEDISVAKYCEFKKIIKRRIKAPK